MTIGFDTLTFAKQLTEAGERPEVAEAHALALKEFVMENLATRDDLFLVRDELRKDMAVLHKDMNMSGDALRKDMDVSIEALRKDMDVSIEALRKDMVSGDENLRKDIETMGLKLTVRLGGMLVVAVGVLASINKFF